MASSVFSPLVRDFFIKCISGQDCFYSATKQGQYGIDVNKAYPHVMMRNTFPYPVYSITDEFTTELPVGAIEVGMFVIQKVIHVPGYPHPFQRVLYPANFVNYLLKRRCIVREDIDGWFRPSGSLRCDFLKGATEKLFETYPVDIAKQLAVRYVGCMGSLSWDKWHGCITGAETAQMLHGAYVSDKSVDAITVVPVGGVYHVRFKEYSYRDFTNVTISQQIIFGGIIQLMELYKRCVDIYGLIPSGVNTDCVYIDPPTQSQFDRIEHDESEEIGGFKLEVDVLPVDRLYGGDKVYKRRDVVKSVNNSGTLYRTKCTLFRESILYYNWAEEVYDQDTSVFTQSAMIVGGPGTGKSYLLSKLYNEVFGGEIAGTTIVLTNTGTTRDSLIAHHNVASACTFEYYYRRANNSFGLMVRMFEGIRVVMVDEICQTSAKWIRFLCKVKKQYPLIIFLLFGDKNQNRPVIKRGSYNNQFDPMKSSALKWVVGQRLVRMTYIENCMRFDLPLQRKLDILVESDQFLANGFQTDFATPDNPSFCTKGAYHITKTNATKRIIDKACMEAHCKTMGVDTPAIFVGVDLIDYPEHKHQDMILCTGMKLICYRNVVMGGKAKAKVSGFVGDLGESLVENEQDDGGDLRDPRDPRDPGDTEEEEEAEEAEEAEDEHKDAGQEVAEDHTKATNGRKYVVCDLDTERETVDLFSATFGYFRSIPIKLLANHFELDYAVTCYRAQSQTITEKVYIHEAHRYTKSELVVALSRATKFSNIYLSSVPGRLLFPEEAYNHEIFGRECRQVYSVIYEMYFPDSEKRFFSSVDFSGASQTEEQLIELVHTDLEKELKIDTNSNLLEMIVSDNRFETTIINIARYPGKFAVEKDLTLLCSGYGLEELVYSEKRLTRMASNRLEQAEEKAVLPFVSRVCNDTTLPQLTLSCTYKKHGKEIRFIMLRLIASDGRVVPNLHKFHTKPEKETRGSFTKKIDRFVAKYRKIVNEHYDESALLNPFIRGRNESEYRLRLFIETELHSNHGYPGKMCDLEYKSTDNTNYVPEEDVVQEEKSEGVIEAEAELENIEELIEGMDNLVWSNPERRSHAQNPIIYKNNLRAMISAIEKRSQIQTFLNKRKS